ncbi:MAG: Fe-S-binding domain-containing protein [Anaerolineaceae bacterium]|nr:Fe-S-binding domain-containing protein [Anaerolineaceae bacterium]
MKKEIQLTIDGNTIQVPEGTTILKAAESIGIKIPTICYHDYCTANALCRICVVEIEGSRTLIPSCVAKVSSDMQVKTKSERVIKSRKTILEMLVSSIDLSESPEILNMIDEYEANPSRFPDAERREHAVIDDNPMFIRDYEKCILCWRCVQVCAEDAQYTFAINFSGRGYETQINTFYEKPLPETSCVFCGQCIGVCPTGALKPKREWLLQDGYQPEEIMLLTRTQRKKKTKSSARPSSGGSHE